MARRRPYEQDNENHERWLISYADFITLLFAFFVVMYAVSVVNIGKYTVLSEALGDAFGGRGAANKTNTMVEVEALPLHVGRKLRQHTEATLLRAPVVVRQPIVDEPLEIGEADA